MQDIRIWFIKDDECRYVSHLDLIRIMERALRKSGIPVWYTQGFNPHAYMTFALPISLGMRGLYESMDIRLTQNINISSIKEKLNKSLPQSIKVINITPVGMKPSSICYSKFNLKISSDELDKKALKNQVEDLIRQENIFVNKKTKRKETVIDLKEHIKDIFLEDYKNNEINIKIILPAGSKININPKLLIKAIEEKYNIKLYYDITREKLYNDNLEDFK